MNNNDNLCPKTSTCALFQGNILESEDAKDIFIKFFCANGEEGRMDCKRFLLTLEGVAADITIMPNDTRSIEELIKYLKEK